MSLRRWFLSPVLAELRRVRFSLFELSHLPTEIRKMSNDFTTLQKDLDAIKTGVADLLTKVAQGSNDQATIDALALEAQGILDAMTPPVVTPPAA